MADLLTRAENETANVHLLEYRAPLWRRIVDRFFPGDVPPDWWYDLHDKVPAGGDMMISRVGVVFDWRALVRLALLGGRLEVELRVLTREPVQAMESHSHVRVGFLNDAMPLTDGTTYQGATPQ